MPQTEHTPDIYLSPLRNYVESLGGRLVINAVFPDQCINLTAPNGTHRVEGVASVE